jgi:hypothetical protein
VRELERSQFVKRFLGEYEGFVGAPEITVGFVLVINPRGRGFNGSNTVTDVEIGNCDALLQSSSFPGIYSRLSWSTFIGIAFCEAATLRRWFELDCDHEGRRPHLYYGRLLGTAAEKQTRFLELEHAAHKLAPRNLSCAAEDLGLRLGWYGSA